MQTTGINLNARYDYDQARQRQVFRGYQASNRVSVKLRDVAATGRVLDALVAAGATDISGPSFSLDDDTAAKGQARQAAMRKAEAMARDYARDRCGRAPCPIARVPRSGRSAGPRGAGWPDTGAARWTCCSRAGS
ncbi:SIMPL domain-containing protein [Leptolyngbya sp. 15MV]|nr:SIMPL domain-containing protein [Leptolyngbya sp. 15MV]